MAYDLIIRGGHVVTPGGVEKHDLGIVGEHIAAVQPEILSASKATVDAAGHHILPGLIDIHVHFNEPGRADWEGAATGSRALAAGGGTLYADMPLNSDPPLLDKKAFEAKRALLEAKSHTDFALWGGLTPDNLDHLSELAACGVIGFKAFMSDSGVPEFRSADDLTLYQGMRVAAQLGLPVAVHAESNAVTQALARQLRGKGATSVRDYLASRPVIAELEAINRALFFAEETGCDLHIVHVSSASGVALVRDAKNRGVSVTCETCPHYLYFSEDDAARLGAVAKCAPPLRSETERRALCQALLRGEIDLVASDHSPAPPALKTSQDFFEVWGGVAGVQSSLNVLLGQKDLPLETTARLTSTGPATRFGLKGKGRLEPGFDADLCLVDVNASFALNQDALFTKHKLSPYLNEPFKGRVAQTFLRGQAIFAKGQFAKPRGSFVRPTRGGALSREFAKDKSQQQPDAGP